ncbi:MAG: hypothetical protein Fur003_5330 [Candidatus Dojkabacteria bacterium]
MSRSGYYEDEDGGLSLDDSYPGEFGDLPFSKLIKLHAEKVREPIRENLFVHYAQRGLNATYVSDGTYVPYGEPHFTFSVHWGSYGRFTDTVAVTIKDRELELKGTTCRNHPGL